MEETYSFYRLEATREAITFRGLTDKDINICGKSLNEIKNILDDIDKGRANLKTKNILADEFIEEVNKIIIGKSLTYPGGWINKKDLLDLIDKADWR